MPSSDRDGFRFHMKDIHGQLRDRAMSLPVAHRVAHSISHAGRQRIDILEDQGGDERVLVAAYIGGRRPENL